MRHKFIVHARNIYERAIEVLPRVDQFWYKYSYMEEMIDTVRKKYFFFILIVITQPQDIFSRDGWNGDLPKRPGWHILLLKREWEKQRIKITVFVNYFLLTNICQITEDYV